MDVHFILRAENNAASPYAAKVPEATVVLITITAFESLLSARLSESVLISDDQRIDWNTPLKNQRYFITSMPWQNVIERLMMQEAARAIATENLVLYFFERSPFTS